MAGEEDAADEAEAGETTIGANSSSKINSSSSNINNIILSSSNSSSSNISRNNSSHSSNTSKSSTSAVAVLAVGAEHHSRGALEEEGPAAVEAEEGMWAVVGKRSRVGGEACHHIPPPPGGYDCSRYQPNLTRPFGNQPPVHGVAPRKICQNCNALGHVCQYCAWRGDPPGHPHPPGLYGQANVATVAATSASAATATAYDDAYGDVYGTDTTAAAADGSY